MAKPTTIQSTLHLRTLISSTPIVIADFHATWCGPCHAIAPIFSQLSATHNSPRLLTFVKIDVDAQQDIAREYGVSAMPTFLVFQEGKVVETVRGANVPALRAVVEKARGWGEEISRARSVREDEWRNKKDGVEGEKRAGEEVNGDESGEKGEETTVSGSYGISKGSGWKMSLK